MKFKTALESKQEIINTQVKLPIGMRHKGVTQRCWALPPGSDKKCVRNPEEFRGLIEIQMPVTKKTMQFFIKSRT